MADGSISLKDGIGQLITSLSSGVYAISTFSKALQDMGVAASTANIVIGILAVALLAIKGLVNWYNAETEALEKATEESKKLATD